MVLSSHIYLSSSIKKDCCLIATGPDPNDGETTTRDENIEAKIHRAADCDRVFVQ